MLNIILIGSLLLYGALGFILMKDVDSALELLRRGMGRVRRKQHAVWAKYVEVSEKMRYIKKKWCRIYRHYELGRRI